jgi:hypothetical protein
LLAHAFWDQQILRRNFLKHMRAFKSYLLDFANLKNHEPSKKSSFIDAYNWCKAIKIISCFLLNMKFCRKRLCILV